VSAAETAESPVLKTGKDKESYAVGVDLARNIKRQGIALDPDMTAKGLRDELSGADLLMTDGEVRLTLSAFQTEMKQRVERPGKAMAEANQKEGEAFLAENKSKPGVITLPSGLQYKIMKEGAGKKPADEDTVLLDFQGTHIDGTVFTGTTISGKPVTMKVKETLPGWKEALKQMSVGSKWQLFIPPQLAYGEQGSGRYVGPNATLIYELELLAIQ
jgi:FKBP-type peptidyl-prolyl cis-trans isomerase FklB